MLTLHSWPTPNGHKIHILLEELTERGALQPEEWQVQPVDIGKGDQFSDRFLAISPNNKIPALTDDDPDDGDSEPVTIFESGAIMMYLAQKHQHFIPSPIQVRAYYQVMQWLMFQMAGFGPMLGQAHHFRSYAPEKIQYGIDRYTSEGRRLYGVVNRQLQKNGGWLASDSYSIADMAVFPWTRSHEKQGIDLNDYPALQTWHSTIAERPAVQRGVQILADLRRPLTDDAAREALWGKQQYTPRPAQ